VQLVWAPCRERDAVFGGDGLDLNIGFTARICHSALLHAVDMVEPSETDAFDQLVEGEGRLPLMRQPQ